MMDAADRLRRFMATLAKPTQEHLARLLPATQGLVSAWLLRRKRPGLKYAYRIERLTGIKAETWGKVELTRTNAREGRAA